MGGIASSTSLGKIVGDADNISFARNFAASKLLHGGTAMPGQGSAGNVLAALASFFIPGLGQLLQGRPIMALIQFVLAAVLWVVLLGWIIHIWSILDAALFKPKFE